VYFDVGDLRALYPLGEQALGQAMVAHAARLGLYVRVGIAASKAVAFTAARARPLAIVPTGGERSFLAPLTLPLGLGALADPADVEGRTLLTTLERWGIGTLGGLASLPAAEAALRLGPLGARLHRLASGRDDAPFAPRLPADALEEGTELEYPIETLEPLGFVLRGLLDRALARLGSRGLGCTGLTLRLTLDPRGYDVRDLPLAAPTREAATLLQHLRLDLARRPPGAPVVGATIEIRPATVRAAQLDLWRPAGPAPEKLAATLARLAAQVGSENVGVPATVSSFREEAVELRPFELHGSGVEARATAVGSSRDARASRDGARRGAGARTAEVVAPIVPLAFRRFRPPAEVEVLVDRDGPAALRGHLVSSRVLVAAGPYRAEGEWWGEGLARDYWDVHADDGAVYRLHHDRQAGRWYLDGYYD
jgi:protein ImuB